MRKRFEESRVRVLGEAMEMCGLRWERKGGKHCGKGERARERKENVVGRFGGAKAYKREL